MEPLERLLHSFFNFAIMLGVMVFIDLSNIIVDFCTLISFRINSCVCNFCSIFGSFGGIFSSSCTNMSTVSRAKVAISKILSSFLCRRKSRSKKHAAQASKAEETYIVSKHSASGICDSTERRRYSGTSISRLPSRSDNQEKSKA